MVRAGIIGWRGMVGSVLVQRMREERDFEHVEPVFFSTSQAGGKGPDIGRPVEPVRNAMELAELKKLPVLISCQGGDFTGGNCTVSLMLMATAGLFEHDEIEWLTAMTYQAASGAGAANMRELVEQMLRIGDSARDLLKNPASAILDIDRAVTDSIRSSSLPREHFGHPLA